MSVLLAVATATPTPEVITNTVTQVVYITPEWVNQLADVLKTAAQLGLLIVPGFLASYLQSVANKKVNFKPWVNTLILFGYSTILAVLTLVATDALNLAKIDFTSPEAIGTAILTVIGAASARYALVKAKAGETTPQALTEASTPL